MRRAVPFVRPLSLFVGLWCASCEPREAALQAAVSAAEPELEPQTVTHFGERVLLFMEHPPLVVGQSARFLAHYSVLATGEPVRAGELSLEIGAWRVSVTAPKREGLFVPDGAPPLAGNHSMRLVLNSEQARETIELGSVRVFASAAEAAAAVEPAPEDSSEIAFLMEQQWKVKLLLARAEPRELAVELAVPALTRAPDGASALVSSPAAGRLSAASPARWPAVGDRVELGQVLAHVEPPLGPAEVAQLRALELELESLSLQLELRALEVTRDHENARAALEHAEREFERVSVLRGESLATQPRLEEAAHAVSSARAELAAAAASLEALERARKSKSERADVDRERVLRLELRAPIAGSIVAVQAAPGESVTDAQTVFRVLDTSRLWIEGQVAELDQPRVRTLPKARAKFPALGQRTFDLVSSETTPGYLAPSIDTATRTFAIRYEFPNVDGELKEGQRVQLALELERRRCAVVIPASALVVDQGVPTVYVMASGEAFVRRELELGLRSSEYVEVLSGLEAGEHVAVRGAHLVKLAAAAPASFGHGHAH